MTDQGNSIMREFQQKLRARVRRLEVSVAILTGLVLLLILTPMMEGSDQLHFGTLGQGDIAIRSSRGSLQTIDLRSVDSEGVGGQIQIAADPQFQFLSVKSRTGAGFHVGSSQGGVSSLSISDAAGRMRIELVVGSDGDAEARILDSEGRIVWRAP